MSDMSTESVDAVEEREAYDGGPDGSRDTEGVDSVVELFVRSGRLQGGVDNPDDD